LEDVCDHVGILSKGRVLLERTLSELQETVTKFQLAFLQGEENILPKELDILHQSQLGRVQTLIVRGSAEKAKEQLSALNPILLDALPLSLEEIFIYELGGEDYAVRELVL
jgi:ABC-2 type transport system ATP-binding protein